MTSTRGVTYDKGRAERTWAAAVQVAGVVRRALQVSKARARPSWISRCVVVERGVMPAYNLARAVGASFGASARMGRERVVVGRGRGRGGGRGRGRESASTSAAAPTEVRRPAGPLLLVC